MNKKQHTPIDILEFSPFLLCLGDYGLSVIQLYIYFSYATLLMRSCY